MKSSCVTAGSSSRGGLAAWLLLALLLPAVALSAERLLVLSYHDVRYDVAGNADDDQAAVSAGNFAAHLQWLHDHRFNPVSMEQVLQASEGRFELPPRAVLLSFDDGYRSFAEVVLPILREFGYPAVLALVTGWLEVPYGSSVEYGTEHKPREHFLHWDQVRELADSGLVEIASHSHDLHRGIPANPQGNTQPAATTRRFADGDYEPESAYLSRVQQDILRSVSLIERHAGLRPRVMVWPFGAFSRQSNRIAYQAGMRAVLTLEPGSASIGRLDHLPRLYLSGNPDVAAFARMMYRYYDEPIVKRSVDIGIDDLYDPDPEVFNQRLGMLVEKVKKFGINTVVVKGFHDGDGDGRAESVYFPGRRLPMRDDVLNRVIWQLRTRAGARWIYVRMPTEYPGLGESAVAEVFEDLGRHLYLTGLFFELAPRDDAALRRLQMDRLDRWRRATAAASGELRMAVGVSLTARELRRTTIADIGVPRGDIVDDLFVGLRGATGDYQAWRAYLEPLADDPVALADHVFVVPVAAGGDDKDSLRAIGSLRAAGAVSVGVRERDERLTDEMVAGFAPLMSLRDHPFKP